MDIYDEKRNKVDYRKIYETQKGSIPVDETGRTYEIHHIDGNRDNNDISNLIAVSIEEHYRIHYEQGDVAACLIMSSRMQISVEEKSKLAREFQIERVNDGSHHFLNEAHISKNIERQKTLMRNGEHPFQRGEVLEKTKKIVTDIQNLKIINRTHSFLKEEIKEKAMSSRNETTRRLVEEGNHIFQNESLRKQWLEEQFKNGTHPTQNNELQRLKTMKRVENGTHPFLREGYQTDLNHRMIAEGRHPSQKKIECPHCLKVVDSANYKRWHGDNCRDKKFNLSSYLPFPPREVLPNALT